MKNANSLSLDFLTSKPQAAAHVLQSLAAEQAALYLGNVPVRMLGPVLQYMEIWPAARILDLLPLEQNAAVFAHLNYQRIAALLRLQQEQRRSALLDVLPTQMARALMRSLAYRENTVGAWMDMSTPHFYTELSARECLSLLKKIPEPFGCSLAVISHSHHVVGIVTLDALLISPDDHELGQLMEPVTPLSAEMSLEMAKNASGWHSHSNLPVRSVNGAYLGALSRTVLRTALASNKPIAAPALEDSVLVHLVKAMATTATGLLHLSSANPIHWHTEDGEQPHGA